jgi:biopolymer transport protein TolR
MAMSTGGSNRGLNSDPNMTPMIDVLLVLLIIFMIVIPMSRKTIDVQLPDPNPPPNQTPDNKQIVLEVGPNFNYAINKEQVTKDNLLTRLHTIYDPRPDKIIFIKGDSLVKFQDIIYAMDVARGAGVKVIGIPPKETK